MIIIIDGYNVLKYMFGKTVTSYHRGQYIKTLRAYGTIKKHKIIMVFDGYESSVDDVIRGDVVVIYSQKRSADDIIGDYILAYAPYDVLVVTSDRAIVQNAMRHDIVVISGSLFNYYVFLIMEKKIVVGESISILHSYVNKSDELHVLMEEYTHSIPSKDSDNVSNVVMGGEKKSKKQRIFDSKLKKL